MFDDIVLYTTPKQTLETLLFAKEQGSTTILVLFAKHDKGNAAIFEELSTQSSLTLTKGLLVKTQQEAQKAQGYTLVGLADRGIVEDRKTMLIYGAEQLEHKDKTHRRGSGLNQVLAKLLAERGKTYLFSISSLLQAKQAELLGRMQQNKRILNKYHVPLQAVSFAREWTDVRSPKERELFLDEL